MVDFCVVPLFNLLKRHNNTNEQVFFMPALLFFSISKILYLVIGKIMEPIVYWLLSLVDPCLPQIHIHLEPQNVILFGNK